MKKIYTKNCEICQKPFTKKTVISVFRWGKSRFCSRKCFGVWSSERQRKLQDRKCLACEKIFRPNSFGTRYCSHECAKHRGINRRGEKHPWWKGGRIIHDGYVRIRVYPDDPFYKNMVGKKDYIFEHRLVMAQMLNRPLEDYETVHHKNGIRNDNRKENLELRTGRHGKGATKHCLTCTCEQILN